MLDRTSRFRHVIQLTLAVCTAAAVTFGGSACSKTPAKTDGNEKSKGGGGTDNQDGGNNNGKAEIPNAALQPCTVVSKEELKKITGIDFTETTPQGNVKALSTCEYSTAKAEHILIISIIRKNGQSTIDTAKGFPKHQLIDGIGDEAVWMPLTGSFDVRKGTDAVGVRIPKSMGDDATRLKYAKEIAKLLLGRI